MKKEQFDQKLNNRDIPVFPLSFGQQGLWLIEQINRGGYHYNIPYAFKINREIDVQVLKESFQAVLKRHPVLRSKFVMADQKPVQEVQPPDYFLFELIRYEEISPNADAQIHEVLMSKVRQPFDLQNDPPFRVYLFSFSKNEYILLIVVHHIVFDGTSLVILLKELNHFYFAKLTGLKKSIPSLEGTYFDFVEWQHEMAAGERGKLHREFWTEKLAGELPVLALPYDHPKNDLQNPIGKSHHFQLSVELTNRIQEICTNEKVTPFVFLLSAFNLFLFKYANQEDILVGTAVHGRSCAQFNNLIGYFINMILIRTELSFAISFKDLLQQVKNNCLEAFSHSDYPFSELVRQKGNTNDRGLSPLMQVAFIFQNWASEGRLNNPQEKDHGEMDDLPLQPIMEIHQQGEFDFSLEIIKAGSDFYNAIFKYNAEVFDPKTIAGMAKHFLQLLDNIVKDINRNIFHFEIITSNEKDTILNSFNETEKYYPEDCCCIHELFEEKVKQNPNNPAVLFEGSELSYAELNERANRLARFLRQKGLRPDDIVAILFERSLEMSVSLFAVLKAGGAYLPIAPGYPTDRIEYILANSKTNYLLVPGKSGVDFNFDKEIIEISDQKIDNLDASNLDNANTPSDLAYVIYTSGTTGNPKGVMIEHRSLVNRLKWMQDAYPLSGNDTILQKTPYTFDVSVWELFWWSFEGAKLCYLPPHMEKFPEKIVETIEKNNITVMHFVPSMLSMFLEYIKSHSVVGKIACLRQVFASGEALTVSQVNLFNQLLFHTNSTKLMNLYGPTEAAIDVSYFDCSSRESFSLIPIGKPISNIKLYVLNEDKRLQPIGLAGELYIAGIGLARGYLNNDRLTKEKFVDNSVESAGNPFEAATKMYKTGDLARWLPDGNIEYLGRIDRQIKIRGFRIELEEIEEALKNYDTIHRSVVTIDKQKDFLGHEQLKAFYIAKDGQEISQQIIRDFLLQKLPEYMVPAIFERVESFPLTGHGKVDVKTLLKNSHVKSAGSLPGTKFDFGTTDQKRIKQIVKAVYRQVLDKEEIDPFTNFFDLGGHSLLMVKAGMLLNEKLQAEINTVELFNYPTISSLSNYLILKLLEKPSTHANHEESHPAGDELSLVKSRDRGKKQRDFLLKRNK